MDSNSQENLRLAMFLPTARLRLLLVGFSIGGFLLPAIASGAEPFEEELRVTFGLVSIIVPRGYEIVITSKQPDVSIGYLEREVDRLRIDFALGLVGLDKLEKPDAGTVAWTLSGEGRLGRITARLVILDEGKMRFDGSTGMAKFGSLFDDEEDVGTLLLILRSVGPPCPSCRRPVIHKSSQ